MYRNVSKADAINWTNNSFAVLRDLLGSFCLLFCLCIFTLTFVRSAISIFFINVRVHVDLCVCDAHILKQKRNFMINRLSRLNTIITPDKRVRLPNASVFCNPLAHCISAVWMTTCKSDLPRVRCGSQGPIKLQMKHGGRVNMNKCYRSSLVAFITILLKGAHTNDGLFSCFCFFATRLIRFQFWALSKFTGNNTIWFFLSTANVIPFNVTRQCTWK